MNLNTITPPLEKMANLTKTGAFTNVTTLWADVSLKPSFDADGGLVDIQQTDHELKQFGNWIVAITYTSSTDSVDPSRIVFSMWTTKSDHAAHEKMVGKIMGFIRTNYKLDDSVAIYRHDTVTPTSILWEPGEIDKEVS
jgi:hypothetical protein